MKEYKTPELEIINIADDVITASGGCDKDLCADAIKCVVKCEVEKCIEIKCDEEKCWK